MRHFRRAVIGVGLLTIGLCSQARAQQVLEQVPSDAVGVFEVKDLQGLSTKIAKLAKTLGIDQFQPQWADPLGSLQDQMGVKQGLNKHGDMAIAFFNPKQNGGKEGPPGGEQVPPLVVLLPTDDYKAFLGNFQDVKDAGNDISEVTVPKNSEKLFIVHRGNYAEAAMKKELLGKPAGMKLEGPAAKEAKDRDAILYFDMKSVRPHLQEGYKQFRGEIQKQLKENNPMGAQLPPGMLALLDKAAGQFISDASSLALVFNLNDAGLATTFVSNFEPDSYFGKLMSQAKNTDQPMLAGLPQRTYLMYFGAVITPQVADQLMDDVIKTLKEHPGKGDQEAISRYFEDSRQYMDATRSIAGGMVAPEPGESFLQMVGVSKGDAQKIFDAGKRV
ncbi:MAG TPA: hypothetical protein VN541_12090, partial [Tepidisphaeraceae bacterium]|nr:hypothetical protein [Tepidisphaeraceae bacterium]